MKKRGSDEMTHADLPILGASGKVFSIGAKTHTTNVQITVLVRFFIDEYTILVLVPCQLVS